MPTAPTGTAATAYDRPPLRLDRRRLHARRSARPRAAGADRCRQRLLELLRPRQPAPALERGGCFGRRSHLVALWDSNLSPAQGLAFEARVAGVRRMRRLVDEGVIDERKKPAGYGLHRQAVRAV